ncbi:SRPBCC family protein [Natronorarus salvus]|uniref:SRPBCC family protein n=1 Tax=Natronorarus salvus TaxID=3117733 RepID=UPI002F2642E2
MTPDTTDSEFDPSEYDLTIERTFDAPRDAVWAAWTDPEEVAEWWGPEGFTVPRCEMDVRSGGTYRIDMRAPDGTIYPDEGEFHEVVEPDRLVFTSRAFEDDDGSYGLEVDNTVTLVERDGRTTLTLEAEVVRATDEVRGALSGMEEGWNGSFEKLAESIAASG